MRDVVCDVTQYLSRLRLRNDLYCVEWGVKLYSLTHSPESLSCDIGKISETDVIAPLHLFYLHRSFRHRN